MMDEKMEQKEMTDSMPKQMMQNMTQRNAEMKKMANDTCNECDMSGNMKKK